jgi:hypothetical protein
MVDELLMKLRHVEIAPPGNLPGDLAGQIDSRVGIAFSFKSGERQERDARC